MENKEQIYDKVEYLSHVLNDGLYECYHFSNIEDTTLEALVYNIAKTVIDIYNIISDKTK